MNKSGTTTGKRGRPKGSKASVRETAATAAFHCTFEEDGRPCGAPISKREAFCIRHIGAAPSVGEFIERQALGAAAAARLREELNVDETTKLETLPDPPVNEDAAAMAMVLEAVGQGPAPERKPRPARNTNGAEEQNRQAQELVWELARLEKERMQERQQSRQRRGSKELPPSAAQIEALLHIPDLPDPTAMVDSSGKSLVKPGYKARWVSLRDMAGNASTSRLDYFKAALGAEDVLGEDGKPFKNHWGKTMRAVQIPLARWAAWILKNSTGGAYDPSRRMADMAYSSAEMLNSEAGRHAVSIIEKDEHGDKRGDW